MFRGETNRSLLCRNVSAARRFGGCFVYNPGPLCTRVHDRRVVVYMIGCKLDTK